MKMKKRIEKEIGIPFSLGATIVVFLCLSFASFQFGMHIKDKYSDISNFCYNHYRDKDFLNSMTGDDPAIPRQCGFDTKGVLGYCNQTCQDTFDKCLEISATEEQIRFMSDCHWMGKDYWIMAFTFMFGFMLPLVLAGMIGSILSKGGKR